MSLRCKNSTYGITQRHCWYQLITHQVAFRLSVRITNADVIKRELIFSVNREDTLGGNNYQNINNPAIKIIQAQILGQFHLSLEELGMKKLAQKQTSTQ